MSDWHWETIFSHDPWAAAERRRLKGAEHLRRRSFLPQWVGQEPPLPDLAVRLFILP